MKISTPLLFATVASAHFIHKIANVFVKRDDAAEQISRNPVPGDSALETVINALSVIKDLTVGQQAVIGAFDGKNLTAALGINTATANLNDATYNATLACAQIGNLSVSDAEVLGAYTQGLAYAVNATIATLISKKPAFEALNIGSLVIQSLQVTLATSYAFSLTVVQKVPQELQIISAALSSQIGESISEGIQCFNGTNTSCITTIANPNRTKDQAIANDTISGANTFNASGFVALVIAIFAAVIAL